MKVTMHTNVYGGLDYRLEEGEHTDPDVPKKVCVDYGGSIFQGDATDGIVVDGIQVTWRPHQHKTLLAELNAGLAEGESYVTCSGYWFGVQLPREIALAIQQKLRMSYDKDSKQEASYFARLDTFTTVAKQEARNSSAKVD